MDRDHLLNRRLGIPGEAGVVAAVLLAWQALRIPIEGTRDVALSHARAWARLHRRLGLNGLQNGVIGDVHHRLMLDVARWSYSNIHVFSIFAFMIAVRVAAPARYPTVRTAFVALHIPALVAIAAFPLASPNWSPHPPQWAGHVPVLTGGWSADTHNQTAAVASEHFAYAAMVALTALWLAPRRRWAAPVLLYPVFVFLVIVGTGHHFPLDAVVGSACLAFGIGVARLLHGPAEDGPAGDPPGRWVPLALGAGLLGGWVDGLSGGRVDPAHPGLTTFLAPALAVAALTLAHRVRPSRTTRA